MGQAVEATAALQHVPEGQQLVEVQRGGFLAEHMETGFQGLAGDRRMEVIGRDDHQQFHALIQRQQRFGVEHLLPVVVATGRWQAQGRAGLPSVVRIAAECAADQFETAVQARGLTVGLADERALSTADEAHSYFRCYRIHRDCLPVRMMM